MQFFVSQFCYSASNVAFYYFFIWKELCTYVLLYRLFGPFQKEFYCVIIGGKVKNVAFSQWKMFQHLIQNWQGSPCLNPGFEISDQHAAEIWFRSLIDKCTSRSVTYCCSKLRHLTVVRAFQQCHSSPFAAPELEEAVTKRQTKKLFDGFLGVKRDKVAFRNFNLSLLSKKCISD